MKILSADIGHKSDLGLVAVGVNGARPCGPPTGSWARPPGPPDAWLEGVVIQPMVTGAVAEAILGLTHQEPFGPTVTFGLGGVFAEVFKDVAFGVPPFSRTTRRRWSTPRRPRRSSAACGAGRPET